MMTMIFWLEKHFVKVFTLLLGKSLRYVFHTERPVEPCIYVFWHRNIMPLLYLYRNKSIVIMISPSTDGELIAGPAQLLGYQTVRGSSTRQGAKALREYLSFGTERNLAITPDGPKGPRERIKKSVLFLAYYTQLPIVHVAVELDKEWVFRTWDLFRLPKPGCIVSVSYSQPTVIKDKDDIKCLLDSTQRLFDKNTTTNSEKAYKFIKGRS